MIITITLIDLHYHCSDFILVYNNILESYIFNIKSIPCWSLERHTKFMQGYNDCSFLRNTKLGIELICSICICSFLLSILLENI